MGEQQWETFVVRMISPPEVAGVISLSKLHQKTLGQLPFAAFERAGVEGRIVGAFRGAELLGYVMVSPRQRDRSVVVTHLCVAEEARGRGVSDELVGFVAKTWEAATALILTCREDYPATRMWPRLGFEMIGNVPGRGSGDHVLFRWKRRLSESTLFELGVGTVGFVTALDADVVRDIVEPRHEHGESLVLIGDWLVDFIELVTTPQVRTELTQAATSNPRLSGAGERFTKLEPTHDDWRRYESELAALIQGTGVGAGDIRSLAQAAAARAVFYVTRDVAVRKRAEEIQVATGLEVISPGDLVLRIHSTEYETAYRSEPLLDSEFEVKPLVAVPTVADFGPYVDPVVDGSAAVLRRQFEKAAAQAAAGRMLWALSQSGKAPEVIFVTRNDDDRLVVELIRLRRPLRSMTLARAVLHWLRKRAVEFGSCAVLIESAVSSSVRYALEAEGFVRVGGGWEARSIDRVLMPTDSLPGETGGRTVASLTLDEVDLLESRYWPMKAITGNLKTWIVPIQPTWARALFDYDPDQLELLPRPARLGIAREHVYYKSLNTKMIGPARVLWWVSGGGPNGGFRAASWLDAVDNGYFKKLYGRYGSRGIYTREVVEKISATGRVTALLFSRTESFTVSVRLDEAKEIHPPIGANGYLQTAKVVDDERVFAKLYRRGMKYDD